MMRGRQFRFTHSHRTSLQMVCPDERVTRNFGENRLTGAVLLDVAKAFDIFCIDGILHKVKLLNFESYLVRTILSYLRGRTFEASFQAATSSRQGMWDGVIQGKVISIVHFSLYVKDISSLLHNVKFVLYADDTAKIAMSGKPLLILSSLVSYPGDL